MIRGRLTKNRWLVVILAALCLTGLLGWYIYERYEHDHHADHDQDHDHAQHADKNDQHTDEKEPEAPLPGQVKLTPEAIKQAGIQTAPVVLGPLDNRVLFTGELVFNEERLAKIRSRVPGRVVQIVADYGQAVKPGEVLAIIDSVELSQAQMASRQAAAKFNAAQKAYDRAHQLYEGKAISQSELQERRARLEVERADLENAQNRLRLLGAGGPAMPKGSRSGPKTSLPTVSGSAFALRTPISGRVVDRKVTPGLVVKEDEELFTVADTSALWCFVQVPEKDLLSVKEGSQATVSVSSLPREEFPGQVDYLADVVDKATRTVRVRVRVDNPGNRLKAGMFANIAVRVGQRTALSIPESAVLAANGDLFVFVEMSPGTYQKHLIKAGIKGGGRIEVLDGLEPDEPVVVQGGFTLKSELEKGASKGGLGGGHGHAH